MNPPPLVNKRTEPIHALHIFTNGNINEPYILFEFTELNPRDKKITLEEFMKKRPGWTMECQDHDTLLVLKITLASLTDQRTINDDLLNNAKRYVDNMKREPLRQVHINTLITKVEKLQTSNDQLQDFAIQTLEQTNQEVQKKVREILLYNDYQANDDSESFGFLYHALEYLKELIPEPVITEYEMGRYVQHTISYKRIQVCIYTATFQDENRMSNLIETVKREFAGRIIELWPNLTNDNSQPRSRIGHFGMSHQMRYGELPFELEQRKLGLALLESPLPRESHLESGSPALETARHASAAAEYTRLQKLRHGLQTVTRDYILPAASSAASAIVRNASVLAFRLRKKFLPNPNHKARSASPPRKGGKSKRVKRVKRSRRVKSSTKRRRN